MLQLWGDNSDSGRNQLTVSLLDANLRAALGYWWNLVSGAAQQGFTVTETVSIANEIAGEMGSKLSFQDNTSISKLYGYARRIINAGSEFQAADAADFISPNMVSIPPYARDIEEQNTYPVYHVKFTYEYIDQAGNRQTTTKTSVFTDQLPTTVGLLTSDVLDDAEAMAQKYGHTLLSVTPIQILAV